MKRVRGIAGVLLIAAFAVSAPAAQPARAADCPGDGTVRLGLIPAEDNETLMSVYKPISEELGRRLGCPVALSISSSYTASIEAMRAKKLEVAGLGPLSYVLARKVAGAEAIVGQGHADGSAITYEATIITPKSTGISRLRDVAGHTFAYSDPASTSGHLMPAYALREAGIDPQTGVHAFFAGSHTASFEALRNHKVDAGEMNSGLIRVATASGQFNAADYVTLWRSGPLPPSPITVRGDLPDTLKRRIQSAFMAIDLHAIPDPKHVLSGVRYVAVRDGDYDPIRRMVSILHVDLERLSE
ncbi:MAG TPA: phosphate/phosphite/phosphonate ABC transporter substrate-binding protein [Candidatus Elarobacter sp.]|jgi:phosphonate transport system substrate-binding protein